MTLTEGLQRLYEQNRAEGTRKKRTKPVPLRARVPTLTKGKYQRASPQLLERFAFAGTWQNALLYQKWLSVKRMPEAWREGALREQVEVRKQYWENRILQIEPAYRVSLLGLDEDDGNETIWSGRASRNRACSARYLKDAQ